jgi:intracellular septation protein A
MNQNNEKKESLLLNLGLNILVPTLILTKLSSEKYLGPMWGVVVALAFPIGYFAYDYLQRGKANFISVLGIISVLLTGGISLLKLDPKYIAIKEAAIPGIIGLITLISAQTRYPVVKLFLFNDMLMQTQNIEQALKDKQNHAQFSNALKISTLIIALSFFLSSVLNYVLARAIVVSTPGTEAYAAELGKMTFWSYIVIMIPSMIVLVAAMVYLFKRVTFLTGLSFEDIFNDNSR